MSWLTDKFSSNSEVKSLKKDLEQLQDKLSDNLDYEAKFYDVEPSSYSGPGNFELAGLETTVNPTMLLRLFATEPWVYSAVMSIAETIAGIPWKLKKRNIINKKVTNEATGQEEIIQQEVWTDVSGAPLFELFQYPNKFCSRSEFLQYILIDLIVTGDCYIYLESEKDLEVYEDNHADDDPDSPFGRLRTALGKDTEIDDMYRLPSHIVKPVPKVGSEGLGIHGYVLESQEGSFGFLPAEIVHIKFPNPLSYWSGLSPLMSVITRILLDRYSTEHMIRFYKSGARLGGIIQTDKGLTKEQITRLQRSFENNYTGRQNFYRTLILPSGMKYNAIEQNPVETSLIELAKANREAILSVLRVPPIKVGVMDHANYANANAQLKIFYDDTIRPRCKMIEDGFNMKPALMPDNRSYKIEFDFSDVGVLQENFQEKAAAATTMLSGGLSVNEVRKKVWKADGVKGGEKVQAVENMSQPQGGFGGMFGASAPKGDSKTDLASGPNNLLAGYPGPTVTSIMNIVGRVSRGKIAAESGAALIGAFGLPPELAHSLVGLSYTAPKLNLEEKEVNETPPPNQPAIGADIKPTGLTFNERVAQLTAQFMDRDKLPMNVAISQAIEQAKLEGLDESSESEKAVKPTIEEYMTDKLQKMDQSQDVTQEQVDAIIADYEKEHGTIAPEAKTQFAIPAKSQTYASGMSKDQVIDTWKSFLSKTDPMIKTRQAAIVQWFKSLKSAVKNQLGANIKAYGMIKARNQDDADEITRISNYEKEIAAYIASIDSTLDDAYKYGFADTLVKFNFNPNDELAKKALRKYGATRIKGITETTMEQVNKVLVDAFEQNVSVQEVAARIDEKFAEIESGRAETIARTETLTAVSIGREEKREEFKREFPEAKLKKQWISAQDEKVRDSHQELDGVAVDVDAEFKDGLRYPRDPACEDPSEVINCRCTEITYVEGDESLIQQTLPKKEDESQE